MALIRTMTDPDLMPEGMSAPVVQHPMHAMVAPIVGKPDLAAMVPPPDTDPEPAAMSPADIAGMDTTQPSMAVGPKLAKVRTMTPMERYEDQLANRQMADFAKDENPYGSANNHPGVFGKILHGLSVATGGPNRRAFEEQQRGKQIEDIEKQKSEQELQGAQTGLDTATAAHTEAETPEVAPNAASLRGYQGAETAHTTAETEALKNPPEEWKAIPSIIGPNGEPVEIEGRSGQIRFGGVQGTTQQKQPKPDSPEQQYIDEYQRSHKGATVADAERAYTNDTQKPLQTMMLVPGENGQYTAQRVSPGAQVAPGAVSATQAGSLNVPTTQQRNVAAQAKLVTEQMPGLISEIQQNKDLLGPVSGRWNEFMQGKVGVDNPQMAGLRADLLMMSSAVALMHARGRLPENLREEFDRAINAPKQTPENLISTLNHINQWTNANINAMGGKGTEQNVGPKEGDSKVNAAGIKVKFSGGKWGPA